MIRRVEQVVCGCGILQRTTLAILPRRAAMVLGMAMLAFGSAAGAQTASTVSLQVTAGGNPVSNVAGESVVTLTATVSAGGVGVSPGQVNFCEVKTIALRCTDIRLLGQAQLTSGGTATLRFRPSAGMHTFQADFLGTQSAAASVSAQQTLTVSPVFPSSTAITYPGFNGNGNYTFNVTVTGYGGTVAPTGTVSMLDTTNGNHLLGSAQLVQGSSSGGGGGGGFNFSFSSPVGFESGAFGCSNPGDGIWPQYGSFAVADFNGDGILDTAMATQFVLNGSVLPNPCPTPPPGVVSVLTGNGDGNFTQGPNTTVGTVGAMATADFNGDGKADLAIVVGNSVQVLLGNGDGTFGAEHAVPAGATAAPTFLATGDFNGDGIEDMAIANATPGGSVVILLGKGDGTFTQGSTLTVGPNPVSIAVGTLTGSSVLDMVVSEGGNTGSLTVLMGKGDGTFTAMPGPSVGANPGGVALADFNGDGILDLAVTIGGSTPITNVSQGSLQIFRGTSLGNGTFLPVATYTEVTGLNAAAVGDFNGDGVADLAISDVGPVGNGGQIWALQGIGDGTFASGTLIATTEGGPTALVAADFNGDGVSDIGAPGDEAGSFAEDSFMNVLLSQSVSSGSILFSTTVVNFFVQGTGFHNVVASYSGDSNYAPSVSGTELVTASLVPTTLSLSASPSPSNYGQAVTLTAIVTPTTTVSNTPTGTVSFTTGGTLIGNATVVGGVATFVTSTLPAGVDGIFATYSGDANFKISLASIAETVNGSQSVTTLNVVPNPSTAGQAVTFTATVSGISFAQIPMGTVTFYSGTTALGQATVSAAGTAVYSSNAIPFGSYVITATYAGGLQYNASTSAPVTLTVVANSSTISMTASPNPGGVGQPVTLSAVIGGVGVVPTGKVTFFDGASAIGAGTVDASGHASFTTSTLALGSHTLVASYSGDSFYLGGTSAAFTEIIQNPMFTITLSNPNITLPKYQHTTTSVTLASSGDFGDSINLSCTNAPANLTCIFTPNPAVLTANGTATVSFYLDTDSIIGGNNFTGPLHSSVDSSSSTVSVAMMLGPLSLFAAAFTRRRKLRGLLLLILLAALPIAFSGCGGSSVSPVPGVAPGTYNVIVSTKGATTGMTETAQLTLVVTNP